MTIADLLQKIEDLKRAGLLRDESRVEYAYHTTAPDGDKVEVEVWIEVAGREFPDRLTLRA